MNDCELTDDDKKTIKSQQDNSPAVRFLRTKDNFNFSVGDFLIKVHKSVDGKWEPETISHVSDQPKRFVCIHEDEYGIKYIKPLTSLGKEIPYITQLTEVSEWTRYTVDPEFAEHIILDGENNFDFSEKRKQDKARREATTRKNKKICVRIWNDTIEGVLASLKPGDKVWIGYQIPKAAESEPLIIKELKKETEWNKTFIRIYFANSHETYKSDELFGHVIFRTEPFKYETI